VADTYSLRQLYDSLRPDTWRKTNPFSDDIKTVNDLLRDTYANREQREEQLSNWLQRFQPCLFGRIAAARHWLHFCILTEHDFLTKSDQAIAEMIRVEVIAWKQRSFRPSEDFSTPAFGFVLVAASDHLVHAAPDHNLQAFAHMLRELWGCEESKSPSGIMHWETLFLRSPDGQSCRRFRFSVDFFAAQGDQRWWHDHRAPGGLMFTANSIGHMRLFREWYLNMKNQHDWILQTAMLTIDEAAKTPYGKATWLRTLGPNGQPIVEGISCPFSRPDQIKAQLKDKDWTKYRGWLHTDHSIRPEFFREEAKPRADITAREYLQDFTYLYRSEARDHAQFVEGEEVAYEDVIAQLGSIDDWSEVVHWQHLGGHPIQESGTVSSDSEHAIRITALLEQSRKWRLSAEDLRAIWSQPYI
jgi:hypothetical protein